MKSLAIMTNRPLGTSTLLVATLLFALVGCNRAAPANVAATVNGRSITYDQLEKQYQAQFGGPTEQSTGDQATIQRLEVLRTLIDNEIMLQRAEKLGYKNIKHLSAGISGWVAAGEKTEKAN